MTGSADHGLRVFSSNSGAYVKELFSKKFGHKDWVSSCQVLGDGRVASAGMDGSICLWAAKGVRCDTLLGHSATISKIQVDEHNTLVSASYDCTLRVWPLKFSRFKHKNCGEILVGRHKSPVMDFDWRGRLLASGDKTGLCVFWDIDTGQPVFESKCHKGGVNCVRLLDRRGLAVTGGLKDGIVNIFDLRTHSPVGSVKAHKACVTSIQQTRGGVVSTGTDSLISVFEE